jgi:hypothetical protein
MCQQLLVHPATGTDGDSVVGEEAHIVSARLGGPRFDPGFDPYLIDEATNLILLCGVHHKMVDDQVGRYTASELHRIKREHEARMAHQSTDFRDLTPPQVRPVAGGRPAILVRLKTGRDVMTVVGGALGFAFDHDDGLSPDETDIVAGFLQEMQDWGDLHSELDAGDRVRAAGRVESLLTDLDDEGFVVFGGREVRELVGGGHPPEPFPIAILQVKRATSPDIVHLDPLTHDESSGAE